MSDTNSPARGSEEAKRPVHEHNIRIDREHYKIREDSLSGAQLRQRPTPPIGTDRDLFQVIPGGSDRKVELEDIVEMRDGLRFFTAPAQINPGNGLR